MESAIDRRQSSVGRVAELDQLVAQFADAIERLEPISGDHATGSTLLSRLDCAARMLRQSVGRLSRTDRTESEGGVATPGLRDQSLNLAFGSLAACRYLLDHMHRSGVIAIGRYREISKSRDEVARVLTQQAARSGIHSSSVGIC